MSGSLVAAAVLLAATVASRAEEKAKPIQDNSFLVEEAYNQEPGVIQHISLVTRDRRSGDWVYSFTEEWPAFGQTHQASATFVVQGLRAGTGREVGVGDVALNYRWQALGDGDAAVAVAPRLSLLLPTGDASRGFGAGAVGGQVNLPISAMLGASVVGHFNLGATWIPSARLAQGEGDYSALSLAQGIVWLVHPSVNLMVEVAYTAGEIATPAGAVRADSLLVSPGVRGALDLPRGVQLVAGVGLPLGVGPSAGQRMVMGYLSLEHAVTGHPQ